MKLYLFLAAATALFATACGDANTETNTEDEPDPLAICDELACDDGNPCTINACDVVAEACVYEPILDGPPCEVDGDPGTCTDGVCVIPTCSETDCIPDRPCTAGACNESSTECVFESQPDGTFCSEGMGLGTCLEGECATGTADIAVTVAPSEAPQVTYFITCGDLGTVAGSLELVDGSWITPPLLLPVGECTAEITVRDENLDPLCLGSADLVLIRDSVTTVEILLSCSPLEE